MELLYAGKAKNVYKTENKNIVKIEYTNKATAGNGEKADSFDNKGLLNAQITNIIYSYLNDNGVNTHLISSNDNIQTCHFCKLIPLEVIIRNVSAGSMAKKMGLINGHKLSHPIFELSYKDDELSDPFINDDYATSLNIISKEDLEKVKQITFKINELLIDLFDKANIILVDFKIEFGFNLNNEILLIDEISPDTMRLWDKDSLKKLDKDNFRLEVGNITDAYSEVLSRLKEINV